MTLRTQGVVNATYSYRSCNILAIIASKSYCSGSQAKRKRVTPLHFEVTFLTFASWYVAGRLFNKFAFTSSFQRFVSLWTHHNISKKYIFSSHFSLFFYFFIFFRIGNSRMDGHRIKGDIEMGWKRQMQQYSY